MRKTARSTYFIAFAFFLAGLGCLLFFGLRAGSAYFVTVSEALTLTDTTPVNMKLFGLVTSPAAPAPTPGKTSITFNLADLNAPAQTILVRFSGTVPPLFKPGAEIIAQGTYDPQNRVFTAVELITKCPSKYEKQNRTESGPNTQP